MDNSVSVRVRAPDETGVESLLEHGEFLQRMVHGLLGDSHDSEDVVQQTWLSVLTTSAEPLRKPRTWLARIAKNRSIDMMRRRHVRGTQEAVELPSTRPGPDEVLEIDSVRTHVCDAVERLAEPYRTSIELRFFEGLPPREVARRMGVPVETARTRIKRALTALRGRLDAEVPGGRRAWATALLLFSEQASPAPAPAWRPLVAAAALAALFLAGERSLPGEVGAHAARGHETSERIVLLEPDVPVWNDGRDGSRDEDTLREGGWDTWPPEPAVEVERSSPIELGRGRGLPGTTWAARRAEPTTVAQAASSTASEPALAPEERPAVQGYTQSLLTAFAAAIDESSPLDVSAEERIVPGQAWTVDPAGGADFTDLASAAAGARSGDVLLLAASAAGYDALALSGKGVSLLGRGDAPVLVRGLALRDLAPNETVVARNLHLVAETGRPALTIERVLGAVWIEDCTLEARDADALSIEGSSAVALLRSRVQSSGIAHDGVPLAALRALASDVSLFDCELVGAAGEVVGAGGHGAVLTFGRLFAMGTSFTGGAGSASSALGHGRGGDGGVGLWAEGQARTLACTFVGGPGGSGSRGPGADALGYYGLIEDLGGPLRSYRIREVAQSAGRARLEASGKPGDIVMSVVGAAPSKGYLLLHLGTRLVAPPYAFVVEGVVPPSGRLEKEVLVPAALALGGGFERYYAQGFFFDSAGEAYLAGASSVFVLP